MPTIRLTDQEQDRLRAAQEALLSPLVSEDRRAWQLEANRAVREYMAADHSAFLIPTRRDALPPVVTDDADPSFPDRLHAVAKASDDPYYGSRDPYLVKAVRSRVEGGAGGYHLEELLTPEEQARSLSVQEVFAPAGMRYMIGLSLPLPEGEAAQFLGFERSDASGYSEVGLRKFRLLVPAYAAGVRAYRRWLGATDRLSTLLDRVTQPLALYDAGCRRIHVNRSLEQLLGEEPRSHRLEAAMDGLAAHFAARLSGPHRAQDEIEYRVTDRVTTETATYRLSATYTAETPEAAHRILVEVAGSRTSLPRSRDLRRRYGLTRRQSEVALLLAMGRSDKAIARDLGISWHTARTHVRSVLTALDVSSRTKVAPTLLRLG